ncbi:MAG TPA: hypothetical protein VMU43_03930 [Candidatus Acidoferrum sp.]|nr:hypothetical protein [Candidatus Acidoferrum sp.]
MNFDSQQDSYTVEISGWDKSENFFVERTLLEWGCDRQHEIRLRSPLRVGSVVFVRLVQDMLENVAFPIAYHAATVGEKDEGGYTHVKLEQMHGRHAFSHQEQVQETNARVV